MHHPSKVNLTFLAMCIQALLLIIAGYVEAQLPTTAQLINKDTDCIVVTSRGVEVRIRNGMCNPDYRMYLPPKWKPGMPFNETGPLPFFRRRGQGPPSSSPPASNSTARRSLVLDPWYPPVEQTDCRPRVGLSADQCALTSLFCTLMYRTPMIDYGTTKCDRKKGQRAGCQCEHACGYMCKTQCRKSKRCSWLPGPLNKCVGAPGYPKEARDPETTACMAPKEIVIIPSSACGCEGIGYGEAEAVCSAAADAVGATKAFPVICKNELGPGGLPDNLLNKHLNYDFDPTLPVGDILNGYIARSWNQLGASNFLALNKYTKLNKPILSLPGFLKKFPLGDLFGTFVTGCRADGTLAPLYSCGNWENPYGQANAANTKKLFNWMASGKKQSCGGELNFLCAIVLDEPPYPWLPL